MSDLPFETEDEAKAEPETLVSNVLVVDDEPVVRDVFSRLLGRETDMVVSVAEDAEQGLELIKQRRFELLITDKNLPGMGGIELIAEARSVRPMIEAVMITGYASSESLISAFAAGASDYLVKPFDDLKVVRAKVRAALQRRLDRGRAQVSSKDVARQAAAMLGQGKDAPEPVWRKLDAKFAEYEKAIREGSTGVVVVVGSDRVMSTLSQAGIKAESAKASSPQVLMADVVVIETGPQFDWHPLAEKLMPLSPDVVLVAGAESDLSDLLEAISLRVDLVGFGGHTPARLLPDRVRANLMRRSVERAQRELATALNEFKLSLRSRSEVNASAPTPLLPMTAAGPARIATPPNAMPAVRPPGAPAPMKWPAARVAPAPGAARTPVTPMNAIPAVGAAGPRPAPSAPPSGSRTPITPATAMTAAGAPGSAAPAPGAAPPRQTAAGPGSAGGGVGVGAPAAAAGEPGAPVGGIPGVIALVNPIPGTGAPVARPPGAGAPPAAAPGPAPGGAARRPTGPHPQMGSAPAPGVPRPVGAPPQAARPGAPPAPGAARPSGTQPAVPAEGAGAPGARPPGTQPGTPEGAGAPGTVGAARSPGSPFGTPEGAGAFGARPPGSPLGTPEGAGAPGTVGAARSSGSPFGTPEGAGALGARPPGSQPGGVESAGAPGTLGAARPSGSHPAASPEGATAPGTSGTTRPSGAYPVVTPQEFKPDADPSAQRPPGSPPYTASPGASGALRPGGRPPGTPATPPSAMPAQSLLPRRTTGSHPQVTSPGVPPAPGAPGARRPTGPHPQVSLPDLSYPQGTSSGPGTYSTAAAYRPQSQPPGPGSPPAGRTATPPSTPAVSGQSPRGPEQRRPSGRFPAASGDPAEAVTEPAVQTMSVAAAEALLAEREREREAAALRRATPVPKPKDEAAETSGAKPPETKPPDGGTS